MYWPAHWYVFFSEHDTKKKNKKNKQIIDETQDDKIGSAMMTINHFLSSYALKQGKRKRHNSLTNEE
jgi:hypothetical protein